MRIGIPKEIKNNENRVGMTPAGVAELVHHGHQVFVQHTAGEGSGFSDDDYVKSGAEILPTIEETYAAADMIVKVKEPIEEEYPLVKKGQVVFTYFHFACDKPLTDAMIASGGVCIAYETVQLPDRSLPLLIPMSEVAGRMATINGAHYLQKTKGGKGKLICGVPGVRPAKVVVLGGGVVGQAAARVAAGMGAQVVIADISLPLLRRLTAEMPANVVPLYSNRHNIIRELKDADIVVGAVLIPGDKAPRLVTRDMLKLMQPGTVLVDALRRRNPQPTPILYIPLMASCTMPLPISLEPCPTLLPSPSPTPRCAMPWHWPIRGGRKHARTTPLSIRDSMWWKERSPIRQWPMSSTCLTNR